MSKKTLIGYIKGPQGLQGERGLQGEQGPKGDKGDTGATGLAGVGIASISPDLVIIDPDNIDGEATVINVNLTNGSTSKFTVYNGSKGSDGKSAYEYAKDGGYTGTEAEFMAQLGVAASALAEAKQYTDEEIAALVNGAPEDLNTINELAAAMKNNPAVIDALNDAIGSKAAATDLTAHTDNKNNPHEVTAEQVRALPLGGGTMEGSLIFNGGDQPGSSKMVLATGKGQITNSGTQTLFGFLNDTDLATGHTSYNLKMRGKATRPSYNGGDLALKSDIPSVPSLSSETWTFTLEDGSTVTKAVYVG